MTPLFSLDADGAIRERPRTYVTLITDDGVRLDTIHDPESGPYAVTRRAHFRCAGCDALEQDAIRRAAAGMPDMPPRRFPEEDYIVRHYATARRIA